MDTPYPSALPPYEAICRWADQQVVSEMRELEAWDSSPFWFFDGSEHDRKKGRYRCLREQLERWLVDRLLQGDFLSWGYEEEAPLDGIKAIPKELWRILEPQFRDEAARAGARRIIGMVVAPREGPQLADQVRLVINVATGEISLDGKQARLPNRTLALLIILAKAVHDGRGPMLSWEIREQMPNSKSDNVVGQAVFALRQRLAQEFGKHYAELVQSHATRGYFLALRPEEIQINP
jgi:hypothetical protein